MYNTVESADAYFVERFGYSKWALTINDDKTKALNSANQILDLSADWFGEKTDPDQTAEFPRDYLDTIPNAILYAECEIAYSIIDQGSVSMALEDKVEELKAGSVGLKFKTNPSVNPLINDLVKKLLSPYGIVNSGGYSRMIPTYRG